MQPTGEIEGILNLTCLRAGSVALALLLPSLVYAQGAPTYQSGLISPGNAVKAGGAGIVQDGGGLLGDINGKGLNPFSVTDGLGLSVCSNTGPTGNPYNALCLGHDANGNGLITLDSYGGYATKSLSFRVNGATFTPGSFAVPTASLLGGSGGALQAAVAADARSYLGASVAGAVWPISLGGTGGATAVDARAALGVPKADLSDVPQPTGRISLGLTAEGIGASVIDQGADKTGASDVHSIVQTLVTSGANAITFPAGTYKFSDVVNLPSGTTTIQCEMGKTTLIAGASHTAAPLFFSGPSGHKLITRGCLFDGNAASVGVDQCFFQLTDGADIDLFEFSQFQNNRSNIICGTRSPTIVRLNRWTNIGWGWKNGGVYGPVPAITFNDSPSKLNAGSKYAVVGNVVDNIGSDFVDAGPVFDFDYSLNDVAGTNNGFVSTSTGAGTGALYLFFGSGRASVIGNRTYGMTGNGIDIHCATDFSVAGGFSNHNGGAGVAISGAGSGDTTTCNPSTGAGDVKRFSVGGGFVANDNYQGALGRTSLTTNNSTPLGDTTLHFASTAGVVDGTLVTGTSIPNGDYILSHTGTTVTLSAGTTGIVANGATITFGYPVLPGPDAGVWLGCVGSACNITDFSIDAVLSTDDQSTKTQLYGMDAGGTNAPTLSKYKVGRAVQMDGNATANFRSIAPTSNTYNARPSNPTGTTSTTDVMAGLAGAITPAYSGTIQFTITGASNNTTAGDGVNGHINYGTGTAPVNGAASTGTQCSSNFVLVENSNSVNWPFSVTCIVTGLVPGTAYWFDLAFHAVTAGTANLANMQLTASEQ